RTPGSIAGGEAATRRIASPTAARQAASILAVGHWTSKGMDRRRMHARPSHDARRRAWRFAMAVLTIAAVWQGAAQSAMAAQHNPRGRFLGVVHSARGAARAQAPAPPASNLTYHDGPVMHTNRTHAIYWEPSGFSTTATYKTL